MKSKLLNVKYGSVLMLLLLISLSFNVAYAQTERIIKGKLTDEQKRPIPGASVKVQSSKKASVTTDDGSFTISAKSGDQLIFSFIGYVPKTISVGTVDSYTVTLAEESTSLKEVVLVGYGTASRKTLSSAITSVKPEDLNKGAISDVGQLLQGKVAGMNISTSGDPNKPAAVILRGASTVNSPGGPFYVIDGIPGADIAAIAPADIATIDVLKDAAATAIYGNRAASGVIMVTTKRGKKGQSQVAYSGFVAAEKVSSKLDLMNADQLRSFLAANKSAFSPLDDLGANTDWMKEIQRSTALSQNHNLSLNGGGENTVYSASLNYFNKDGILSKSSLERIIGRLSIDQYALNNKVKFSLNLSNSSSKSINEPLQNIVLLQAAKRLPVSPVFGADGSYAENLNNSGYFNPLAIVGNADDETKYNVLLGGFNTEVKLPWGLTYNLNLSYQRTTAAHGEFYSRYFGKYPTSTFYNNPDPGIGIGHSLIGGLFGTNGSALRSNFENSTKTLETFLTWDKEIEDHKITAVLGYTYQDNVYGDGFQTSSTNFPTDNIGFNNLTLGNPYGIPSYRINLGNDLTYGRVLMISDFFRVNYSYKNRYLLQGSIRRDGSSVFGANNQWGYFPSVGLAWRISEEDFMKNQKVFSDLKLRLSYGVTGNSSGIGPYTGQLVYGGAGTYYNNGIQASAYAPIQGSNPDLKWERTATKNIGLDFGLFNNKVTGSVDVYDKNTTDMLFRYNVSASLIPGGAIWANGGSINNKGIELSLAATPVTTENFSWSTSINLAHNKNKITSLKGPYSAGDSITYSSPEGPGQSGATLQILKTGYPLGQFFTLKYAGKDANGNSTFYKRDGSTTTDPAIGTDYFYLGSPQPKLLLGWSNTFKYKALDLNVFLRGTFGNKVFNATRADLSYVAGATVNNIVNTAVDDKLTDNRNSNYSDRYIENGSYLRLDNATLGYNFPAPVKNVSNIRLYVSTNNLFTITGYKGIDPEVNQGGVAPGVDNNNFYPKTRTFLFGVNVLF